MHDLLLFLRAWFRHPRRVGAVAPSGRALAERITDDILPMDGPVIELGPGTGAFTRALLARGVPQHQLALVESDPAFADSLGERFPQARLLRMDAVHLGQLGSVFGDERAGAVVSGLPLVAMPMRQAVAILDGAFRHHLRPDGRFYQFTYGPRFPVPQRLMARLGLEAVRVAYVVANVPPASVYRVRRRAPGPGGLPD
ncbi:rRNA adenine N-6-methyltransferase family protein [Cupriavidus basilensis]|uniref:rRNA adenine N-6-methyltransferase family protein n=1 Tax=Cupriavidus basilensis TaxID=68895 RepID=A0ABT6AIZ6_9BURK|nr:rRNA adenine N-6-methyltransferase family protein [Cupriavidus basilensis]MDF3832574.1 rRNA adenine N-6-methyltransferase family protein [Cupriavidus basilensis]